MRPLPLKVSFAGAKAITEHRITMAKGCKWDQKCMDAANKVWREFFRLRFASTHRIPNAFTLLFKQVVRTL